MNGGKIQTGRVLIVEQDVPLGALYADLLRTHCPGLRIDCCHPDERTLVEDNVGGADIVIFACDPTPATALGLLREILMIRPCLATLALIPAEHPALADEAIAAGATDVLLKAPGYLEQLAVATRKNVQSSRTRTSSRLRAELARCLLHDAREQIAELRDELAILGAPARAATRPGIETIQIRTPSVFSHAVWLDPQATTSARAA